MGDTEQMKELRSALQPDGSFGMSPVSSRFWWVLTSPAWIVVLLVPAYFLYAHSVSPLSRILGAVAAISGVIAAFRGARMPEGAQTTYCKFLLQRDRVVFFPGAVEVPYADLEYVEHSTYRGGYRSSSSIEMVAFAFGGRREAFRWNTLVNSSVDPARAFRAGRFNPLLGALGFRPAPGEYSGLREIFHPEAALPASVRIEPRETGFLETKLSPRFLLIFLALVLAALYVTMHFHLVTCATFGVCRS